MRTWVLSPSSHRGLCARAGVPAGLSTTWDELRETAPNAFTIKDTANRTDHLPGLTPADPTRLIQAVDQLVAKGISDWNTSIDSAVGQKSRRNDIANGRGLW